MKLVHWLVVSEQPQFKLFYTAPYSSPVCLHLRSGHPKCYQGCGLFPMLHNRFSGLLLVQHESPEIVSISWFVCVSMGKVISILIWTWWISPRPKTGSKSNTHSLTMRHADVLLLCSWKKLLFVFFSCFSIGGNGSILPSPFCEWLLEWLSWGLSKTQTNSSHLTFYYSSTPTKNNHASSSSKLIEPL